MLRTVSCGQTLTTSTRLANDLAECQGDGLVVGAPDITIDLDGRTIDGTGLSAGIRVNGHDRVTITGGGRLTQFDHGIAFGSGTRGGIVSGVTVELNQEAGVHFSNADEAGEGNLIRDTLVTNNSLSGIAITGGTDAARIIGNTIGGNPAAGVRVGGASGTRVEGNTITSSGDAGVLLEGATGTVVVENDISGNSGEPVADHAGLPGQPRRAQRARRQRQGRRRRAVRTRTRSSTTPSRRPATRRSRSRGPTTTSCAATTSPATPAASSSTSPAATSSSRTTRATTPARASRSAISR